MYTGIGRNYYDLDQILSSINQEQLFLHYLGILPNASGRFYSPFRHDRNPGCRFEWHSGILYLVENTMYKGKLYWSIFDCMQERFGMTFYQAIDTIVNDYNITNNSEKQYISKTKKQKPTIRFTFKPWQDDNLFFLPNEVLQREYVYLVEDYWIGRDGSFKKNAIHDPKQTTVVAYHFPDSDHVKLYFPQETEMKWYSNCDIYDIFGKYKLNYYNSKYDYLVITKSQKDRLILDYKFNIPSIAVQNEGCNIPEEIIDEIRELFPNIYIIFDNDETGNKMADKLCQQYEFNKLILPQGKDSYEFYKLIK